MELSKLPYSNIVEVVPGIPGERNRNTQVRFKRILNWEFRDLDRLLVSKNQMLLLRRYNCLYWVNINFITPIFFYSFTISILASNTLEHLCVCFAFI